MRALDAGTQQRRAQELAALHASGCLVLPNAWDAGSAAVVARAGARAVATTSGGTSWCLGLPDGGALRRDQVAEVVAAIVRVVDVPVTADVEAGYDDVASTVHDVLVAGAVGVNLEDRRDGRLLAPAEQAVHLVAARAAADAFGVPLVLNARTDVYLLGGSGPDALADVAARAAVYAQAGADVLFVPGLVDLPALEELVARVPLPVAVMTWPGGPTVGELAAAGVRRVSVGTALAEAAYAVADRAARELLTTGTCTALEGGLPYGELNALLTR